MQIDIRSESYEDPSNIPINLAAAIIQDANLSVIELEEVAEHLWSYVNRKKEENKYDDNRTNG